MGSLQPALSDSGSDFESVTTIIDRDAGGNSQRRAVTLKEVSQFEANLIRILRTILGQTPIDQTMAVIFSQSDRPRCLSRACIELVKDSLSKGMPLFFARQGWIRERFIQGDSIVEGRLWQRTEIEQLALEYSRNSIEWLIWLTSEDLTQPSTKAGIAPDDCTTGDALLFLLTFDRLRLTAASPILQKISLFRASPLATLLFPDEFSNESVPDSVDFDAWFTPQQSWILEALQPWLCKRWFEVEAAKQQLVSHITLLAIGNRQRSVLTSYLDAAEKSGRRDLTRFILETAARILRPSLATQNHQSWFANVQMQDLRMADRQQVYESANALFRSLERLDSWNQAARTTSFYDEGYTTSQLWKSDWEQQNGDAVCQEAKKIVQSLTEFSLS